MAFDMKQLRTCKELLKIAKPIRGFRPTSSVLLNKIFVRFGRFYATNGYILVSVEWDEYQYAADEEWCTLSRFMDSDGKLVKFEFETCETQRANDFFEKQFVQRVDYKGHLPVNPKLLIMALRVFEINDVTPIMVRDDTKWELSGHNEDVSIRAIGMGIRR